MSQKLSYVLDHLTKNDLNNGIAHTASMLALVGVFAHVLPVLAALAPLVWYGINIYESKTVQKLLHRRRAKARLHRLTKRRAGR